MQPHRLVLYHVVIPSINKLLIDAFSISSSFTMLFHFTEDTCSPNVLFMDEKADSAIHRMPYPFLFFHRFRSLSCCITDSFRGIHLALFLTDEFPLTLMTGIILISSRCLKLFLES